MITALVVTYQRKDLLEKCLNALLNQTHAPDKILVVDNASQDGTDELFLEKGIFNTSSIEYFRLNENLGGAGGFHEGIKYIKKSTKGWIWMMDDDAAPDPEALDKLIQAATSKNHIYGSTAVSNQSNDNKLCWPVELTNTGTRAYYQNELPDISEVSVLPFLGFYIHSNLVDLLGLPARDFFLSGDDAEYCFRASKHHVKLLQVSNSIIRHPLPDRYIFSMGTRDISILRIPPWKRYYDVRNRIIIAKSYYPVLLWTQTLPGILLRWAFILTTHENRLKQSLAFFRGIKDGFLGNLGTRWAPGS